MRVDFTSSHQELVLELVVQIRTTVALHRTDQECPSVLPVVLPRTSFTDNFLRARSRILLLIWWQRAHICEFTDKLWWRLCLVGLSYPKDHGRMWTIFRLAEISVRSRCQKWWKYWKRRGFRNFFCHLPLDNCFSMDFYQTPKIWACEYVILIDSCIEMFYSTM